MCVDLKGQYVMLHPTLERSRLEVERTAVRINSLVQSQSLTNCHEGDSWIEDLFKLFRRTVDLWAVQTYRGVIAGQLYGECRSHSRREMH